MSSDTVLFANLAMCRSICSFVVLIATAAEGSLAL